ncbi:MAG: hypothetical protein JO057_26505 [Chloroflexi bacterium]|nr:hypothetical protein [Chloroflexota bacterium]
MFRLATAGLLGAALLAFAPLASAQTAQPAPTTAIPPVPGVLVGQMPVTDTTWNFSSNLPDLGGPWGSVMVTNTNCTTPYRPGTAQAGAVIFTAPLTPGIPSTGNLQAFTGSSATGQVKVLPMADSGGVNVTANLSNLEPSVQGTTLTVCLTLTALPPMLADINVGQQRVAANNFDVTGVATATTDGDQPLIGISGTQTTADGTNRQWTLFFLGDQYLGSDTTTPSLAPLQLIGSPGPDQLSVTYTDPAGGQPVTITYTLSNGALNASGTPPGH